MTGADFDNPGFTTAESILRERAVNVVSQTGGLPIDLFIKLVNAGIDPEEVQRDGARRIWRGPGSISNSLRDDDEARYEDVPGDEETEFFNHYTNTED